MDEPTGHCFHRLVTRGNLDGIACASVFLEKYSEAAIDFVTSPPQAILMASRGDDVVTVADLPLNEDMAPLLNAAEGRVRLIDHHPTSLRSSHAVIDEGKSAAGALHDFLGRSERTSKIAALADHYERADSHLLRSCIQEYGMERIEHEAEILDLAWRFNVEDDRFRLATAQKLSSGLWPSEVHEILERSSAVQQSGRWAKAIDLIATNIETRGKVGVLDLRNRRLSLHGFGSVALSGAARDLGCDYTVLLHESRGNVTASLRSTAKTGVNLGNFVTEFTKIHGVDGGGHARSAGARITYDKADLLVDMLTASV
jgi:hypothetical protein